MVSSKTISWSIFSPSMLFIYLFIFIEFFLISMVQALHTFSQARPPGIYKQDYIEALYTFYHENPENWICPSTPEWKRPSDLDLNGEAVQDDDDDADTAGHLHVGTIFAVYILVILSKISFVCMCVRACVSFPVIVFFFV